MVPTQTSQLKRLSRVAVRNIVKGRTITMHYYVAPNEPPLAKLVFKPLDNLMKLVSSPTITQAHDLDIMWHAGWYFRAAANPRPNWSGFMQDVTMGRYLPPDYIRNLPIIDVNPSDKSCMLSTLLFIADQASKLGIQTPCVTFDQPLWIKAVAIVSCQSFNIVCRMGVFHMIMSFLGSNGHVMQCSGLSEALETCYGPNAVQHMLGGKAVDRALRGHYLVESALYCLILHTVLQAFVEDEISVTNSAVSKDDIDELKLIYDTVCEKKLDVRSEKSSAALDKFKIAVKTHKDQLA